MLDNLLLFLANSPCDDVTVLKVVLIMKRIIDVVFIIVPIALIVMVTIDLVKNVISGDQGADKKSVGMAIKRIIYAIIVFMVPAIVRIFIGAMGDLAGDYSKCMNVTSQSIEHQISVNKSKCNGANQEWNDIISSCVKKKTSVIVQKPVETGTGSLGPGRNKTNSNENFDIISSDDPGENGGTGDYGGKFRLPLDQDSIYITSGYGPRSCSGCSSYHRGLDLRAGEGTKIFAVEGGEVVIAKYAGARGNYVVIKHQEGLYTFYQHCSKLLVSVGTKVDKGMIIALSGHTGGNYAPHLHFEVTTSSSGGLSAMDPCKYKDFSCSNGGKTGGYLKVS